MLACADVIEAALKDVAEVDGARDAAAWLTHRARQDRGQTRRALRLAEALDRRWQVVADSLRAGSVNLAQAQVIVDALDALPDYVDAEVKAQVKAQAEARLVTDAATHGPRALRVLGRRILDVVAAAVAEEHERRRLDAEDAEAARKCFVRVRRNGDGTTDIHARLSDLVADRLLTYLNAYASPRRDHMTSDHDGSDPTAGDPPGCPCTAATPPSWSPSTSTPCATN